MRKIAAIILACVLTCSFIAGAFVADAQAKNGNPPNDKVTEQCRLVFPDKEPACNLDDCRMYYVWLCPYGIVEEWTGEYCPPLSPCWN